MTKKFIIKLHLSDNAKLCESIRQACSQSKQITLLKAPCSSGKTYSILKSVAPLLPEERNLVLAVPNVVQTLQNRKYGVEAVTGDNYIIHAAGTISSVTYDKVQLLEDWPIEELAKTTLVIDEAHMLVTEQSYRSKAIQSLLRITSRILEVGGSVMLMTATPRRVIDSNFLACIQKKPHIDILDCIKVDDDGNEMPGIQAKKIKLLRKPEGIKMPIYVLQLLTHNKANGKQSLLMLNNKKWIDRLEHSLNEYGITTYRITADDKGFWQEPIYDSNGVPQANKNCYANVAYGDLIESECLPEADAYLCTSVVEAGTNIKGIKDKEGVHARTDLIPIYIADGPAKFDIDKCHQFLARVRFTVDEAMVVLGTVSQEQLITTAKVKSVGFERGARCSEIKANATNWDVDSMTDISGNPGNKRVYYNGTQFMVDSLKLCDQIWNNYSGQLYRLATLDEALEEELGVPVVKSVIENDDNEKLLGKVVLDVETCAALETMINDDEAYIYICNNMVPDPNIKTIKELIRLKNGYKVCTRAITLAKLEPIKREMLSDIIIAEYNGEQIYVESSSGKRVNSKAEAKEPLGVLDYYERKGCFLLSNCSQRELGLILKYIAQEISQEPSESWMTIDKISNNSKVRNMIRYMLTCERMKRLIAINKHGDYENNLRKLMWIGATQSIEQLKNLELELDCIVLNQGLGKFGSPNKSLAEYMVLRNPKDYLIRRVGEQLVSIWCQIFPKREDMIGYLNGNEIQQIAEDMSASVKQLTKSRRIPRYNAKVIYHALKRIYVVKEVDSHQTIEGVPDKIEIKRLRKKPHQIKDDLK